MDLFLSCSCYLSHSDVVLRVADHAALTPHLSERRSVWLMSCCLMGLYAALRAFCSVSLFGTEKRHWQFSWLLAGCLGMWQKTLLGNKIILSRQPHVKSFWSESYIMIYNTERKCLRWKLRGCISSWFLQESCAAYFLTKTKLWNNLLKLFFF